VQDPLAKVKEIKSFDAPALSPKAAGELNIVPQPPVFLQGLGDKEVMPVPSEADDVLLEEFLSLVATIAMRLTDDDYLHNNSNVTVCREVRKTCKP